MRASRMITANVFTDTAEFAPVFLRILDKDKRLVPLVPNAVQRDYLHNRTGRDLILKARQLGFTTIIQADLFRKVVTSTAATMTLSHEDETTQKFRRMVDRFYDNWPGPVKPARKYSNARVATYPDFDSEALIATAGNTNTGRGGTYTDIHGSEVAFWKDAESIVAGVLQAGNPNVVLESTANGANGYFYTLVMEALDGNKTWCLHFYPWWADNSYRLPLDEGEVLDYTGEELELMLRHGLDSEQIKWRRAKQKELKHLFPQEYPEDPKTCFLLSGSSYFGDLSAAFSAPSGATYDPSHEYFAGVDWGQSVDYTVCSVIDKTADCQVEILRVNGLLWGEMRKRIRQLCAKWHVKRLVPEANSMGKSEIENLRAEFKSAGLDTRIKPFWTDNTSKSRVASSLYDALHERGLKLVDDPQQKRELQAFQAIQLPSLAWKMEGVGEHDDTVIALMLAEEAANGPRAGLMG